MRELIRLRHELESCRNDPIERKCNQLKEEIEILQQKCYKKQMKYAQRDTSTYRTSHMTSRECPPTRHMTKPVIDLTTATTDESDWEEFDEVSLDVLESLHDLNEKEFADFEFSNSSNSSNEDTLNYDIVHKSVPHSTRTLSVNDPPTVRRDSLTVGSTKRLNNKRAPSTDHSLGHHSKER